MRARDDVRMEERIVSSSETKHAIDQPTDRSGRVAPEVGVIHT